MIFNKKYFLAIFAVVGVQLGFGVNSAIAVPCEAEFNSVIEIFKESSRKNNFTYQGANVPYNFVTDIVFTSPNDFWPNLKKKMSDPYYGVNNNTFAENVDHFRHLNKMARDRAKNGSYEPTLLEVCYTQAMVDANGDIDAIINGKTSNKSSSSGSFSQSNKKANRQTANNQSSSSNSSTQSNQQSGSNSTNSNSGSNLKPEQTEFVNEAAQTYATKTAAFEESHKGLKRTHNKGDEASRCLKMDGRQITNTCDFRVGYIFCAYNPDQKAFKAAFEMAAAFDCEKRQMGMQGAAPRKKQAGTFTSEAVYIFGCKDPSLPSGVTYERGRGLSGWCE